MLLVSAILCWTAAASIPAVKAGALCDETKFDEVSGRLLLYANDEKQPETPEELSLLCQKDNQTFEWIENYTKGCVKGIAGGIMRLLLDSSGEELHSRCYGDLRQEYLEHTPCLNTVANQLSGCNREMTSLMEATMKLQKRKHLLANSCCSIQIYAQCLETRVKSKCSQEAGEFVKGIIHRIGENLLEGACGKFTPDSDECRSLPKASGSKKVRHRSFVPAMIGVLKHYG